MNPAINGSYAWTGAYYNSKAVYNNSTYNIWYTLSQNAWVISSVVGAAAINWVSEKTTIGGCPNGTYDAVAGTIVVGTC